MLVPALTIGSSRGSSVSSAAAPARSRRPTDRARGERHQRQRRRHRAARRRGRVPGGGQLPRGRGRAAAAHDRQHRRRRRRADRGDQLGRPEVELVGNATRAGRTALQVDAARRVDRHRVVRVAEHPARRPEPTVRRGAGRRPASEPPSSRRPSASTAVRRRTGTSRAGRRRHDQHRAHRADRDLPTGKNVRSRSCSPTPARSPPRADRAGAAASRARTRRREPAPASARSLSVAALGCPRGEERAIETRLPLHRVRQRVGQVVRPLPRVPGVGHGRGGRRRRAPALARIAAGAPATPARPIGEVDVEAARARPTGVARARPGARRRSGAGRGRAAGRRARGGQVHAAARGRVPLGGARRRGRPGAVRHRRGVGRARCGCGPSAPATCTTTMYLAAESDLEPVLGHVDAVEPGPAGGRLGADHGLRRRSTARRAGSRRSAR